MKVKCVRFLDENGNIKSDSAWLTIGQTYHVMEIYISSSRACRYRIISNHKDPGFFSMGLHPAECFEITSDIIPSNWKMKIHKMSAIEISPARWQENNFLEDFYDADPAVYPIFEAERDIIMREDP
ncbi:hypothetical protein [Kerstersia sp.]|uniref:hypothetical protein n=1 Tax=Kerstersia sp. TaxID=1930783 RepID=UPI003F8E07FC